MRLQEHMIDVTKTAAAEAFRYARAVPADKLEWQPLENGRSVLDIARELTMCPTWCLEIISTNEYPAYDEATMAEAKREMEQWKTLDDCERECQRRMDALFEYFRAMPDERLTESKWLPYEGGRDFGMPEMMDYPRWNFTYHTGQIAYIQTLYGDKDMH